MRVRSQTSITITSKSELILLCKINKKRCKNDLTAEPLTHTNCANAPLFVLTDKHIEVNFAKQKEKINFSETICPPRTKRLSHKVTSTKPKQ